MFKNEYQGGPFFEIFTSQGKDPTALCKINGSGIKKVFDEDIRSYVYTLNGTTSTTRLQLPKDAKRALGLTQRFLVFQLFVAVNMDFSLELGICDSVGNKHRLNFSTSHKELNVTQQVARIPLLILKRNIWCNVALDLSSFVGEVWHGVTFRSLDSLIVSANCKLTRIFTVRVEPLDTSNTELFALPSTVANNSEIPEKFHLPPTVQCITQLLNVSKLQLIEWKGGTPVDGHQGSSSLRKSSCYSTESSSRENSAGRAIHFSKQNLGGESSQSSSSESVRQRGGTSSILRPHPPAHQPEPTSSGDLRRRRFRVMSSQREDRPLVAPGVGLRETKSAGAASVDSGSSSEVGVHQGGGKHLGSRSIGGVHHHSDKLKKSQSGVSLRGSDSTIQRNNDLYLFHNPPMSVPDKERSSSMVGIVGVKKSASIQSMSTAVMTPPQPRREVDAASPTVNHSRVNRKSLRELSLEEVNLATIKVGKPLPSAMTPSPRPPTIHGGPTSKEGRKGAKSPLVTISMECETAVDLAGYKCTEQLSESFEARMLASLAANDDPSSYENLATSRDQPHEPVNLPNHLIPPRPSVIADSYSDEDDVTSTTTGPLNTGRDLMLATSHTEGRYLDEMMVAWPTQAKGGRASHDSNGLLATHGSMEIGEADETRLFSPLIHLSGSNIDQHPLSSSPGNSHLTTTAPNDEEIDLLFDSELNCYYDPKTCKYYKLA